MKHSRGFTLVELMISLAVFALLVMMAYQSVNLLLDASRRVEEPQAEFQQLQRAMAFVERDMHQLALLRPANNGQEREEDNSIIQPEALGVSLEFTRGGNPDVAWQLRADGQGMMRSSLQRVRYVLEDGKLLRQTWNLVDHVESAQPVSLVLLDGVEGEPRFRFRLEAGGGFVDKLPKVLEKLVAVEFSLQHKRFGSVRRIFMTYL
ncbi:type II secretion system minor pseudopilin GspJ [Thiothrix nivea]|uniref:Type II secretion system protein J n=1 Tax=Thiothrix nivea (strain ATCC 35100 / DSM 5205 / JP2) TaxID=870187 RepID=A0A656HJL0_THINJ|nr:type II secretion system minor pseudopilin GspJ [Thiothrix nivea]EIJ35686.1 general secretion pathway protein J [Thiothrix nivea DSM 5205]